MAYFSWEVAEELAFLVDPRQVKLLEASDGSLVLLPARLALLCAVLSPCQCCLWYPSPSETCREQAETEEGAAQAVPYVAWTTCHSLIGGKQCALKGCQGGAQGPTLVAGEPTCSLILYQAGCSPSFSFLVEAGLREGLVYESKVNGPCMMEMEAISKSCFAG